MGKGKMVYKYEAKMFCLENNIISGTEKYALVFGFALWLQNKGDTNARE